MDPQSPLNLEVIKQSIKMALTVTALVFLVLINSKVHQVMLCMMRTPIDTVMVAPPSVVPNCTTFRQGPDLRVVVCPGKETGEVSFYQKNTLLRSYLQEDATRLVDWLRRCTGHDHGPECPFFTIDLPDCTSYSPFSLTDYICHHNQSMHLVINRFRFSKKESKDVIAFILQDK